MLSDKDKALQRAFDRHIREMQQLIDEIGGTKMGAKDKGSAELKHAYNKLKEARHWIADHFFENVIQKERDAERTAHRSPGGGGGGATGERPFRRETRPMIRPRVNAE